MELVIHPIDQTKNSTISEVTLNNDHICYILEDGYRTEKEYGATRIPEGYYSIIKRRVGSLANKIMDKFKIPYIPHITDVPDFKYIYIHNGNTVNQTHGCLLTCTSYYYDSSTDNYIGTKSNKAFRKLWKIIDKAFRSKKEVAIHINRESPPIFIYT